MKINKALPISVISCIVMIIVVSAVSYAYIGRASASGTANVTGNIIDISSDVNLSYTVNDVTHSLNNISSFNLSTDIGDFSILEGANDYSSYVNTQIAVNVNFNLTSNVKSTNSISCDYDIYFFGDVPSDSSLGSLHQYGVYSSTSNREIPLDGIYMPNHAILDSGTLTITGNGTNTTINRQFLYDFRIYNLAVAQNFGDGVSATIYFDVDNCRVS